MRRTAYRLAAATVAGTFALGIGVVAMASLTTPGHSGQAPGQQVAAQHEPAPPGDRDDRTDADAHGDAQSAKAHSQGPVELTVTSPTPKATDEPDPTEKAEPSEKPEPSEATEPGDEDSQDGADHESASGAAHEQQGDDHGQDGADHESANGAAHEHQGGDRDGKDHHDADGGH